MVENNQIPNTPQQQPINSKKMKSCKSCGAQISKKAKTCPQCGAKNKSHKGLIIIGVIIVVIILIVAISSRGNKESSSNNPATVSSSSQGQTNASVETVKSDENELGKYSVEITNARLTSTYDNKPAVVITYKYTNNSDDNPTSFYIAFDDTVYQNGVGLNKAYTLIEGDPYDERNSTKEIKKGASIDVDVAYALNDESTPIDVEVKELWSLSDKIVSKTFDIK